MNMIKLHLGCGKRYMEGWIHVDIINYDHVDIVTEIEHLSSIDSNSVDEIYVSHTLEHIGRRQFYSALNRWYECLKSGGILRVAVPDFEAVVNRYQVEGNLEELLGMLVGGQRNEYDHHKMVFDFKLLSNAMKDIGFIDIKKYNAHDFLGDLDDYSKSYLPHMDFENGQLMSLNVVASKP